MSEVPLQSALEGRIPGRADGRGTKQDALAGIVADVKKVKGVKSVQRVVCGGCLDFKVTALLEYSRELTAILEYSRESKYLGDCRISFRRLHEKVTRWTR